MPTDAMPDQTATNRTGRRDWSGMIGAVLFILLGLWVLAQSRSMSAMGSIFPMAIAISMIAFSLCLLAVNLLSVRGKAAPAMAADEVAPAGSAESTPRRLALVGILVAWALLLPVVGFVTTSALAFLAILAVANYDSWTLKRAVVYSLLSIAIVLAFYLLLVKVLLVPMPAGLLF